MDRINLVIVFEHLQTLSNQNIFNPNMLCGRTLNVQMMGNFGLYDIAAFLCLAKKVVLKFLLLIFYRGRWVNTHLLLNVTTIKAKSQIFFLFSKSCTFVKYWQWLIIELRKRVDLTQSNELKLENFFCFIAKERRTSWVQLPCHSKLGKILMKGPLLVVLLCCQESCPDVKSKKIVLKYLW